MEESQPIGQMRKRSWPPVLSSLPRWAVAGGELNQQDPQLGEPLRLPGEPIPGGNGHDGSLPRSRRCRWVERGEGWVHPMVALEPAVSRCGDRAGSSAGRRGGLGGDEALYRLGTN